VGKGKVNIEEAEEEATFVFLIKWREECLNEYHLVKYEAHVCSLQIRKEGSFHLMSFITHC